MIDRIEQADDVAFDLERVGDSQFAVEQSADRLCNDRLAIARRAVDEHRVRRADCGADLIEDPLAQHECENASRTRVRVIERGTAFRYASR